MKLVGVRELKNRLSEYLRFVKAGEEVLVTDRGEVVARLSSAEPTAAESPYPILEAMIREGLATRAAPKDPSAYPKMPGLMKWEEIERLLDETRGDR